MSIPARRARTALLAACLLVVPGCSDDPVVTSTPAARPSNPMDQLTDPSTDDFVAETVPTVLDEQGEGSATFTVPKEDGVVLVTYYVTCSPAGEFTLTVRERWFSGECGTRFRNSGGIPTDAYEDLRVELELPDRTEYWVVGVPEFS